MVVELRGTGDAVMLKINNSPVKASSYAVANVIYGRANQAGDDNRSVAPMPEAAENVASDFGINGTDQDAFAKRSQQRVTAAIATGGLAEEIQPVTLPQRKREPVVFHTNEHPCATTLEKLNAHPTPFRDGGSIALVTMCICVGQNIALALEAV